MQHSSATLHAVQSTILCVDDEQDVTDLLQYHLTRSGYRVLTAATGRSALHLIHEQKPDLVILDLMLPDIDGFGICEILRHDTATATLPIIILSAWATTDAHALGLDLGALAYLTKPFSPKTVVAQVTRLLDLRPSATQTSA